MNDHDHDENCNTTHPKDRAPQSDDPMEISGIEVDGDPEVMLDCIVEEYARLGCDADMIMRMFDDPFYQGPYGVTKAFGREYVRRRIDDVLRRCGVLRVRVTELVPVETESGCDERQARLTIGGRAIAERT
ncbi:hypothetical protein BH09PLA1_BH09PLA1_00130 [soil metagenome]